MKQINPIAVGVAVTEALESQDPEIDEVVLLVKSSRGMRTINLYGGR